MSESAPVSYVVPVRWTAPGPIAELADHLEDVAGWVDEVILVDDSPPPLFANHARRLRGQVRHIPPDAGRRSPNGKVDGILTGVGAARNEWVVIADDDVRWQRAELERAVALLEDAELVRPQNCFRPLVWHARLDTARSLLNRVFTGDPMFPVGDFPGTFALRRDFLIAIGGYDGTALFENLEMMRKVAAAGGRIDTRLDLYVARVPPSFAHFRGQRVRQAYDDWAIPGRMAFFLALVPALALLIARGRRRAALAIAAAPAGVAEIGRRRAGGSRHFPLTGSLLAPLWVAERSICVWIALWRRIQGTGVQYGRGRLTHAATTTRRLRAALAPATEERRAPEELAA